MSSQPASNKFLELVPQKNGLKIILSAEGKEEIKELREQYPKWNNDDIFFELFDTIRGNSEYDYHPDGGEAGFGLTNAPMITDGYYPSESGRGYDTDYPESAEVYYYDNSRFHHELDDEEGILALFCHCETRSGEAVCFIPYIV